MLKKNKWCYMLKPPAQCPWLDSFSPHPDLCFLSSAVPWKATARVRDSPAAAARPGRQSRRSRRQSSSRRPCSASPALCSASPAHRRLSRPVDTSPCNDASTSSPSAAGEASCSSSRRLTVLRSLASSSPTPTRPRPAPTPTPLLRPVKHIQRQGEALCPLFLILSTVMIMDSSNLLTHCNLDRSNRICCLLFAHVTRWIMIRYQKHIGMLCPPQFFVKSVRIKKKKEIDLQLFLALRY